jgi:hypothetical protein
MSLLEPVNPSSFSTMLPMINACNLKERENYQIVLLEPVNIIPESCLKPKTVMDKFKNY